MRQRGYEVVRAPATDEGGDGARPGTIGRTVLRDEAVDGTDGVFLVRVKEREFPPPEAFSPRDYSFYLTMETLGDLLRRQRDPKAPRLGILPNALYEYFGDIEGLKRSSS